MLIYKDITDYFQSATIAEEYITAIHWKNGKVCPHCGVMDEVCKITPRQGSTRSRKSLTLYTCLSCRKQFTITVGTIFERSHIPLNKWLLATHLMCSSKKGISAHQLHRLLKINYRSAWYMAHRIRHSMGQEPMQSKLRGIVEADETYIGARTPRKGQKPLKRGRGSQRKIPVFSLIERGGRVRSQKVSNVKAKTLKTIIRANVSKNTKIMTDTFPSYKGLRKEFKSHETVNHNRLEYVRGNVYTNTAENYFSILKRGIFGIYHHVSGKHLNLYLNEFDFRYTEHNISDEKRTIKAIQQATGKRWRLN